MIKILNKMPQQKECWRCRCKFTFDKEDVFMIKYRDLMGHELSATDPGVECPVCKELLKITLK